MPASETESSAYLPTLAGIRESMDRAIETISNIPTYSSTFDGTMRQETLFHLRHIRKHINHITDRDDICPFVEGMLQAWWLYGGGHRQRMPGEKDAGTD